MTTTNLETMTYDELSEVLRTSNDADARVAAHARMKELREAGKDYHEIELEGAKKYIEASRRFTFGLCELTLDEGIQAYSEIEGIGDRGTRGADIFRAYKNMFVSAVIAGWSARDDWGEEEIRRFFDVEDGCFINEDYACYPQMRDMALAGFAKAIEAYKNMNDDAASKLDEANFDLVVDTVKSGVLAEYALAL